jgi:dolichol-phosphate mannosyltransferase
MKKPAAARQEILELSIVIPCHNEEECLGHFAEKLGPVLRDLSNRAAIEVVLVDDGSTDGTWKCLSELAAGDVLPRGTVRLERHAVNRGLGAALRTGFAACRGRIVITTDSDATYEFREIPALLDRLSADVDIVTASPYHPEGSVDGVPRYRLFLSRGSSFIYRLLVGRQLYTYTALFRAYRAEVIRNVAFGSNGFLSVAELLVNAMLAGYRVAEYPTVLHARSAGESKAKLIRTIAAHLRYQLSVLFRRWNPGLQKVPRMTA